MRLNKFKKFVSNNYKMLIPIVLISMVFLAFIIYYFVSNMFTYSDTVRGSYYQFLGNEKISYDVDVTKNSKGVITKLEPVSIYVSFDSIPLYNDKGNIVIFPSKMSAVLPIMNCSEYLIKDNSYITYENKKYDLTTDKYNEALGHYFLYDGEDLYFFIENVTLVIGEEKIEISPLSYIIVKNNSITYYDKKNDSYNIIDVSSSGSYITNDYYKVYVSEDYIDFYGERVILTSDISYLSTIDQMKRSNNS